MRPADEVARLIVATPKGETTQATLPFGQFKALWQRVSQPAIECSVSGFSGYVFGTKIVFWDGVSTFLILSSETQPASQPSA